MDVILLGQETAEALAASLARAMAHAVPVTLDRRRRGLGQRLRELLTGPVADLL